MSSSVADSEPFFDPRSISGCCTWVDASRYTGAAATVTSLTDLAENTSYTVGGAPTWNRRNFVSPSYGNLPGFDMTNGRFIRGLTNTCTLYTHSVFMVGSRANLTGDGWPMVSMAGSNTGSFEYFRLLDNRDAANASFRSIALNTAAIWFRFTSQTASPFLFASTYSNVTLSPNIYYGGTAYQSWSNSVASPAAFVTNGNFVMIGTNGQAGDTTTNYWPGVLSELIIYNTVLNTQQQQQIEGYLAWKWGLQASLPANHPYKTSPIPPLLNPPLTAPDIEETDFFNPTSVTGCTLWLDASDISRITFTGSNITNVADKSPANITLSNATGYQYRRSFNGGYPSFFSDAPGLGLGGANSANTLGRNASLALTTPFTFFIVAHQTVPLSGNIPYGYLSDSVGGVNRCYIYRADAASSLGTANSAVFYGNPSLGTFGWVAGTSTAYNIANGSNLTANTATLSALTTDGVTIGNRFSLNEAWPGHICEVLIYTQNVSLANRQQIEGYLAWKWGIQSQLPSYHPYKNSVLGPLLNPPSTPAQIVFPSPWQPIGLNVVGSPIAVTYQFLWLDASTSFAGYSNQQIVYSWSNISPTSSGEEGTALITVGGEPRAQTNFLNKLTGVRFNGNGVFYFGNVLNLSTQPVYIFSVVKYDTTGDGSIIAKSRQIGLAGRWFLIRYAADGGIEMGADATGSGVVAPSANTSTSPQIITGYWNRSNVVTRVNGTQVASAVLSSAANLSNTATLYVGGYENSTGTGYVQALNFTGVMGEILCFFNALSDQQIQQIEGYLAWKWGLVANLPANHLFKLWPPPPS